jgi:hypothetical protein
LSHGGRSPPANASGRGTHRASIGVHGRHHTTSCWVPHLFLGRLLKPPRRPRLPDDGADSPEEEDDEDRGLRKAVRVGRPCQLGGAAASVGRGGCVSWAGRLRQLGGAAVFAAHRLAVLVVLGAPPPPPPPRREPTRGRSAVAPAAACAHGTGAGGDNGIATRCGIAGKSQSVLVMVNPMILTRTRPRPGAQRLKGHQGGRGGESNGLGQPSKCTQLLTCDAAPLLARASVERTLTVIGTGCCTVAADGCAFSSSPSPPPPAAPSPPNACRGTEQM